MMFYRRRVDENTCYGNTVTRLPDKVVVKCGINTEEMMNGHIRKKTECTMGLFRELHCILARE